MQFSTVEFILLPTPTIMTICKYVLTIVTAIVWPVTVLCPSVSVKASEYALFELCSRLLFTTNSPSVTKNNILQYFLLS